MDDEISLFIFYSMYLLEDLTRLKDRIKNKLIKPCDY